MTGKNTLRTRLLCGLMMLLLLLPSLVWAEEAPSTRWADAADEIDKFLDAAFESYLDGDPDAAYNNVSNAYFRV
jgi:high-affinity iron transporter